MSKQVTICSVGDLMVCDSPLYVSVGVGSKYSQIRGKIFTECREILRSANITIGNFEASVYEPKDKSLEENQMCCSEDVMEELHNVGFNVLSISNNHCLQHGREGFQRTIESCKKRQIQPLGIRDEEPFETEIEGIKIVFFSLCIHKEWYQPDNILYEDRVDKILKDIKNRKEQEKNTVIVVCVHWGDEFATYPSNAQIALAHKFIDFGANIIFGHHSHVYQGIEVYKDGVIVYGQGNFVSDMVPKICKETAIVKIAIIKTEKGNSFSWNLYPYIIDNDYLLRASEGAWYSNRQSQLDDAIKGEKDDNMYWKNVRVMHKEAHDSFIRFFKSHFFQYNFSAAVAMISRFVSRKVNRIIGKSTDGRISSMDPYIFQVLDDL